MPTLDYDILIAELRDDPLGRGYAEMTDEAAAAKLNAVDVTVPYSRRVTIRDMLADLGATETAETLKALHAADDPNGLLSLAIEMLGEYGDGGGLDIGHPNTRATIDQLEAAGVLTADQAAAIKGLAEHAISRAEQLDLPPLDPAHIGSARKLMNGE